MSTDLSAEVSRIFERAKHEALALLLAAPTPARDAVTGALLSPGTPDLPTQAEINQYLLIASKPYLTRKEAALYLGVTARSIAEWAARPLDQNPFPEARAGGEPRTKRTAIDEWVEREVGRQRLRLAG